MGGLIGDILGEQQSHVTVRQHDMVIETGDTGLLDGHRAVMRTREVREKLSGTERR